MSQNGRDELLASIRREIDLHLELAEEAFGEELQARRPGTFIDGDDDAAEAARLRGELYASVAVRVAAATSEPEILAAARTRITRFLPVELVDGWIRKGSTRG